MRYLVCFVFNPNNSPEITFKPYPLKHAVEPEDLTYPENTIAFVIKEVESIEKLYESYVAIAPIKGKCYCAFSCNTSSPSKFYLVGKKVNIKGKTYVYNKYTETHISFVESDSIVVVE